MLEYHAAKATELNFCAWYTISSQIGASDNREKARKREECAHLTRTQELEAREAELTDAMYVQRREVLFIYAQVASPCAFWTLP